MKDLEQLHFGNRDEFRNWLEANHDKSNGIWMIYHKKHVEAACIKYTEALEEALCFGWIDSLIKRLDEDSYARKFTPRTDIKKWSDVNKRIVSDLLQKGKMTQAGLSKIDAAVMTEIENVDTKAAKNEKREFEIPDFILREFAANEPALTNFNKLASTYKKHFVFWITQAKREETIRKRMEEAIGLLKANKKLGLK